MPEHHAGNGDLSPPGGSPAPTSDSSPLDAIDTSQPVAEQLATMVEWAKQMGRDHIEDRNRRDEQYDTTLRVIRAEGERTRGMERVMGEQFGHLASALLTLGTEVTGLRADLKADRAERDAEKAALIRELGARAQHDSRHDEAIAQQGEKLDLQEKVIARLWAAVTWRNAGKGGAVVLAALKLLEMLSHADVMAQVKTLLP